jgi:DNA (cytosine-5)-methyltransferase 1
MDVQPAEERANIRARLARLQAGGSPRLVDLFAGCGGMSVGFHRAGYEIAGGVEIDPQAARTHATNFFAAHDQETRERHATPQDITTYTPQQFMREVLGTGHDTPPGMMVDVIAGGPPCQAFARIGRAKLREIMQQPQAHLSDDRAGLYLRYLQYVAAFKPLAVVVENVPEIMNFGGQNVAEEIAGSLEEMGYRCKYTLLNSALYGVPQLRSRWFLIALHSALGIDPSFPAPTHYIEVPSGYMSAHAAALRLLIEDASSSRYCLPPVPSADLPGAVTTRQALDDLPRITAHLHGTMRRGPRKFDVLMGYRRKRALSEYARDMREWPGFESDRGVWDHVTRYLPRDHPIFRRMRPGDEYPRAHELAMQILEEALEEYQAEHGTRPAEGSEEYARLRAAHVPPYSVEKFPNKWWKLHGDQPSRTLTAHMGRDTYSHIHYDSGQARVLSVREAARLQSFPDGFTFTGSMNGAFRQIGNAVPPLQAYALALHVLNLLSQGVAPPTPAQENTTPAQPEPMLITV